MWEEDHDNELSLISARCSAQKNSLQLQCIGRGSGPGPGMMSISGDQDNVVTLNLTHLA